MQFLKDFLRNLLILGVIAIALLLIFPDMMSQVFQAYGLILGPAGILALLVFALPRRSRKR